MYCRQYVIFERIAVANKYEINIYTHIYIYNVRIKYLSINNDYFPVWTQIINCDYAQTRSTSTNTYKLIITHNNCLVKTIIIACKVAFNTHNLLVLKIILNKITIKLTKIMNINHLPPLPPATTYIPPTMYHTPL